MFLTNFGLKYPRLSEKETRIITILSDKDKIPKGDYVIQELYCTDKNCDCRKVSLNIIGPKGEIYYIDYGFEKPDYYMEWGVGDLKFAEEMSGLSIDLFNGNPRKSELMYDTIKWVLNDEKYVDRLKKHYFLMKDDVELYQDPFKLREDEDEDNILYLGDNNEYFEENNVLNKKQIKERNKKKIAKKQRQKLRKKKKK